MARPKKNTNKQLLADKMRKAVLQAAIEGKLTEQHPTTDGYARDLLADIESTKQRLIKAGEIKRQKSLPDITEEEKPFDIPDSWEWVRLGDLCLKVSSGSTPTGGKAVYKEKGIIFIRSQNVHNDGLVLDNVAFIEETMHKKKPNGAIYAKDILLNITGASIGRACVISDDFDVGNTNQHVLTLRQIEPEIRYFVHTVLISPFIFKSIMDVQVGGTKEGLSASKAKELLIPLPPLAEQQRIVAKVKEALAQIDILHADENALYALQTAFPRQMQASLLQAAIEGKLTQQDATKDGNAYDLLADIETEREKLIETGELKRQKSLSPITEEEKPFDIPDNWVWVRLGEIGVWRSGSTPSRSESKYYNKGEIPWLKTGDLNDSFITETSEKITELALEKTSVTLQPIGAVLIAMYGATIGKLGLLGIESTTNQACCGCMVFKPVYNYYLFYFLLANRKRFIEMGAGGAQPNISKDKIVNTLIPLPPLAEQHRIVDLLKQALPEIQTLKEI